MQIILREDVPHLGRQGDVVKVADGYARNFLLPRRLAYRFTEGVRRQVETEARAKAARGERERVAAGELRTRIEELQVIRLARRAGPTGVLYGSVTNIDIAAVLKEHGFEVDRRQVRVDDPIKQLGTHRVTIHVHKDVDVQLHVEVEPEEDSAS